MKASRFRQENTVKHFASPANLLALLVTGQQSPARVTEETWREILPLAVHQGLAPALVWAVRQVGFKPEPDGMWQPVYQAAQATALHAAVLKKTTQGLTNAFREAEISAIWLKGIALGLSVYPELRLRPMVDLDVLVPRAKREAALRLAAEFGFLPPDAEYLTMIGAPDQVMYHDALWGGPGKQVCLEVHFHLLGLDGQRLLPEEQLSWFWGQSVDLTIDGFRLSTLTPEAHLLYLCAHAVLQHRGDSLNLLRLLDLYWLITKNELDWQVVVEKAIELRWAYAVDHSLSLLCEVYGVQTPESAAAELRANWEKDGQQRAGAQKHSESVRWDEWRLIFENLPRGGQARFIWNTLFPPGPVMRSLYSIPPAKQVFPYYLYRWVDGGREVFRALTMQNKMGE